MLNLDSVFSENTVADTFQGFKVLEMNRALNKDGIVFKGFKH
jgi:hypothetical protein